MFQRFTDGARHVVVQAQHEARRLGHSYIGCEHLLLAATEAAEPAAAVLRDRGITPERVEAEIVRIIGRGPAPGPADPLGGLDREALAAIGIDLDVVRDKIEAAFGPDALARAVPSRQRAGLGRRRARRPALGRGPVAGLRRARPPWRVPRPGASGPPQHPAVPRPGPPPPVHAAGQEDPGAVPAAGRRPARRLHRPAAPRPRAARPEGRHVADDPDGPRRLARFAACRRPGPLPQGELIPFRRRTGSASWLTAGRPDRCRGSARPGSAPRGPRCRRSTRPAPPPLPASTG